MSLLSEISEKQSQLTKHAVGSVKELCALAIPLMLSALSGTLMIFIDRVVLSHYSATAMNAAASAGIVFAVFQFGSICIAAMAQSFVGQYNGAKRYSELAKPVWQMIWFSLLTTIPFTILALWGSTLFIPAETVLEGRPFLSTLLFFGPIFPLNAALGGFFIGQGKVKFVTTVLLIASGINFILDLWFVFGYGHFPAMGAHGAALATGLAQSLNAVILITRFLWKDNRLRFNTHHWQFCPPLFMQCLKVGAPNAIGHMVHIAAWAVVMFILTKVSFEHITVFAMLQSVWILLMFIVDGLQKSVSTVCANLIGANQREGINKVLRSGIRLQSYISLLLALPLVIFPEYCMQILSSQEDKNVSESLVLLAADACLWVWLGFWFDGINWVIAGILTAAGDTRFVMKINAINGWFFGVLPYFIIIYLLGAPVYVVGYLMAGFSIINCLCFVKYYRKGAWQKKSLLA